MKTTLADLKVTDTFRWFDADADTPLMTVVGHQLNPHRELTAVLVERSDGEGLGWPVGCDPDALVEPMGA